MRFLLLLPLFLVITTLQAQNGTTLEEYRYLTKGYAYQKGLGLDAAKEGYSFKELYTSKEGIEFVGMYRFGRDRPQAILCVFDKGIKDNSFVCLPNNSSAADIIALANQDRATMLNYEKRQQLDKAITELLFNQMGTSNDNSLAMNSEVPKEYGQQEEFTPKGVPSSQPLVASSSSAPSYPTTSPQEVTYNKPDMVKTGDIWDSLPINSSSTPKTPANNASAGSESTVYKASKKTSLNMTIGLENREIVNQPAVVTSTKKAGIVVIKLCVNQNGEVISSKFTQKGSTTLDAHLREVAQANAAQIQFQPSHLAEQCGTLTYLFNK